tara:strand:+ start:46364 stop:48739 length:2376 start_codon:yes stop_codon:yes gene_type:complete
MDLRQNKLTKEEWCALEVPVDEKEKNILKLIYNSWENPAISENSLKSFIEIVKIHDEKTDYDSYFYKEKFKPILDKLKKKYSVDFEVNLSKKKVKLKKKDIIRVTNLEKKIEELKDNIFEYVILKFLKSYLSSTSRKEYYYYILVYLMKCTINHRNKHVLSVIQQIIRSSSVNLKNIVKKSADYIEKNKHIIKHSDIKLYNHQADIIKTFKRAGKKLVLYQAPTGTGKTLTPIALSRGKKIIFVCAAKHIGLQLAKSCISMEIPIAVAFGCEDPGDIRLHYYAAKDYKRNFKTGGIFRVDNSVGDKVEVIISDIQSYLPAMNYMMAFNNKEDIILYWDEPTITLDYEEHPFHEILKNNWKENMLDNIVLSSATLPNMEDIGDMLASYKIKNPDGEIVEIKSYECKKSIPLISSDGYAILPHLVFENYDEIKKSVKYLEQNKTIMRHFSVDEISQFIMYVTKNNYVASRYKIQEYFETIDNITIEKIKDYYLILLKKCKKNYEVIFNYFKENKNRRYNSTIKITTEDSHTLTDGPTIFIANDVKKVAGIFLKASNIKAEETERIMQVINKNDKWKKELEKLELEDEQKNQKDIDNGGKNKTNKFNREGEEKSGEAFKKQIELIRSKIKAVELNRVYIPNKLEHLRKWTLKNNITNEFSSNIQDNIVEEIMLLNIAKPWKILLLMGIGVFEKNPNIKYMEIMKKLAEEQKLYLIIASSDYIYGTNYQFCHGYISKDLSGLTQEKLIQAFGRIGRKNNQLDYTIRVRDNNIARKILLKEEYKVEVINMNRIFSQ